MLSVLAMLASIIPLFGNGLGLDLSVHRNNVYIDFRVTTSNIPYRLPKIEWRTEVALPHVWGMYMCVGVCVRVWVCV